MRLTSLVDLRLEKFSNACSNDEMVWKIKGKIASRLGAAEGRIGRWGWGAVKEKPTEMKI